MIKTVIYGLGKDGILVKKDTSKYKDLVRGQIIKWGGNIGWGPEEFAILSKTDSDFGTRYKCVSLDDPHFHYTDSHNIKKKGVDDTWHNQHMWLLNKTFDLDKLDALEKATEKLEKEKNEKMEKRQKLREEFESKPVEVGDILLTSWGYDMTHNDYCIVLESTGKTVKCQMVNKLSTEKNGFDGYMGNVRPITEKHGKPFRLMIRGTNSFIGSYPFCKGHDSKKRGYFGKVLQGDTHYENKMD